MAASHELDSLAINTIRGLSMDAVQAANSGHPGTPMALAPLGWVLFSRLRRHDPRHPDWPDRDRFILSCGHASMLQYALLHLAGYDLSLDEIRRFRQWDSLTPGHPEYRHTPGVETTTGPLGQGVANGVGMAMAEQHLAARFNRRGHELFDHHTWVLASDGDLMEGVSAEAASLAGHLRLGKLTVFYDDNQITIDGRTDISFSEDVGRRFESYGWHVQTVEDGNDLEALEKAGAASKEDPRPSLVRVRTVIGWPAPNKKDTPAAHGSPLGEEEIAKTKEILGLPSEPFWVPADIKAQTDAIVERGAKDHEAWQAKKAAYQKAHPSLAPALSEAEEGRLPEGWDQGLPVFETSDKGLATRKAGGQVLGVLAERIESMVGGSADLAGSTLTYQKGAADFGADEGVPRNVHWGVREHAMGACMNGLALHGGVVPYGATFLIFSDYMRPTLRLASLMGLSTRYVFTHDSIGLGEDGPTHQPIEHLASLRAIPGLAVLRPSDANETRECWKAAMKWKGPAALVLTRQGLPTLDRNQYGSPEEAGRGAYVVSEASQATPQAIIIGTGSEVHIALQAQRELESRGRPTRVVSMPCWELFEQQDSSYRERVLPPTVTARVAVEAGVALGWERWVGSQGACVTLERFGASAPAAELYEKLGITAAAVVQAVERVAHTG